MTIIANIIGGAALAALFVVFYALGVSDGREATQQQKSVAVDDIDCMPTIDPEIPAAYGTLGKRGRLLWRFYRLVLFCLQGQVHSGRWYARRKQLRVLPALWRKDGERR